MQIDGFDWDDGNWPKCARHGLTKAEIESVFLGWVEVFPAKEGSLQEMRQAAVGTNGEGRYIFAVFTVRQNDERTLIRPISARFMHEKEIRHYEQQKVSQILP